MYVFLLYRHTIRRLEAEIREYQKTLQVDHMSTDAEFEHDQIRLVVDVLSFTLSNVDAALFILYIVPDSFAW